MRVTNASTSHSLQGVGAWCCSGRTRSTIDAASFAARSDSTTGPIDCSFNSVTTEFREC
jgi:hypothetical protein